MDAPFAEMVKAGAMAKMGQGDSPPGAPCAPGGLGLVNNATSDTKALTDTDKRPLREKLLINRDAQRVKRMRTAVGHAARLLHFDAHSELAAQRWNKKFITLTYADVRGWRPGHFTGFRKALREWCVRRKVKCRFVWVAELTKKGAMHYHVVLWLPKGKFLPFVDTQGWWPHGMTKVETAREPVSYIMKYASKTTANDAAGYPKGARMHGCGGLDADARRHLRYWQAPFWVRDELSGRADIRKVTGGYMDKITGEFLPSPWRVCIGPGGEVWVYRIDQEETKQ
ncbi:rolling circle replication-associated protein [Dyella subtropica]|uniref:rolling circle replication-associated protein n=1 Tax=Dyella subtropica TaxID=2992127 RepID=UPI00225B689A|nr:replication initiation protein [Dyella subtropica]